MNDSHSRRTLRPALAAVSLSLGMLAEPAWAYLDPGTGSMIISAIVGLFATVGLALKTYWYKIKAFLRRDGGAPAVQSQVDGAGEPGVQAERSTDS